MPTAPPAAGSAASEPSVPRRRRLGRVLAAVLAVLVLLLVGGGLWLRGRLRASLPQLDGQHRLAGLTAPVTVERDALGVPAIRGGDRLDVARALGFLHAQERFFQMDLLRRKAAGELAELVGPAVAKSDRAIRVHRFRAVAQAVLHRALPGDRALLDAYTAGVNSGLAALGAPPPEYLLLRQTPVPWRPEDSFLVVDAMFIDLELSTLHTESTLGLLHDLLPPALFAFLAPQGTEWDAPLTGDAFPAPPIPGPEVVDLRHPGQPAVSQARPSGSVISGAGHWEASGEADGEAEMTGSNNWAVAAGHSADGHAWLANDMHLGLRVPNTWYRAELRWPAAGGGERRVTGVTLPGTPLVVVGSNGHVAWGFTNSYIDWLDLIVLETDPAHPDAYRTPEGWKPFTHTAEVIRIKGGKSETLDVLSTIWGPVVDHDYRQRPRALAWAAQHDEAVNLRSLELEGATNIDQAMAIAHASGIPTQNFTVVDDSGRIGWTLIGQIPRRVGFDGEVPTSWADGTRRWDGWLKADEVPAVVDPPAGRVWTANARVANTAELATVGDGGYDSGARAHQIRDDLAALDKATPKDLMAIQLDDRALFLARWRDLLLATLTPEALAGHPQRAELRRLVDTTWNGHAAIASPAYRLVRAFRLALTQAVLEALTLPCQVAEPELDLSPLHQAEAPVWRLVQERPMQLLSPRFKSWDEQLLSAVDAVIDRLKEAGPDLGKRTWGEVNQVAIRHPLSLAVPALSRFLDIPTMALPGDSGMPRVQGRNFGASERLVVSPGHEEQSLFHMPAGQSGHFLSPHYRDSQPAWAEGRPTPFLPGPVVDRLELLPAAPVAPR